MLKNLVPDYALPDIYAITPALLRREGIRGVLIDLDGTMASRKNKDPSPRLKKWMAGLQRSGISVLVLSNNGRLRVERFARGLGMPFHSRAKKPFRAAFVLGAEKLNLPPHQIAVVGDQIYTDTLGGNRFGAKTFFVDSIDHYAPHIWLRYQFERPFVLLGKHKTKKKVR